MHWIELFTCSKIIGFPHQFQPLCCWGMWYSNLEHALPHSLYSQPKRSHFSLYTYYLFFKILLFIFQIDVPNDFPWRKCVLGKKNILLFFILLCIISTCQALLWNNYLETFDTQNILTLGVLKKIMQLIYIKNYTHKLLKNKT